MVFPKSIDSGCRDWIGGVYRKIPRDCITVLIGKRPRLWIDSCKTSREEYYPNTSDYRSRIFFLRYFPIRGYGATLQVRRQPFPSPDSSIGIPPSSNPSPHPPPLNPVKPSVDFYTANMIIEAPLHISSHRL